MFRSFWLVMPESLAEPGHARINLNTYNNACYLLRFILVLCVRFSGVLPFCPRNISIIPMMFILPFFFGFSYAVCNIYAAFGCKINFLLGRKKAACAKYIVGAAFITNMFVNVNDMYALLIYALLHIHTSEEKKSPKFDAPRNIQHGTNDGNGMRMWIRATASKCQKLTDLYEIKMRERVRQQQQ